MRRSPSTREAETAMKKLASGESIAARDKQARSVIEGLEADVVDLGAGLRHRRDRPAKARLCPTIGKSACRTTARPTHRPSSFWFARAIPKASRTGTTWSVTRGLGDHAQSQDLRRSAQ